MHGVIDISKVVGTVQIAGQTHEVCAEADATFDRSTHVLSVKLISFLHSEEQTHVGEAITAAWLPPPELITEHVDADEASSMAKDVFASWCRKVQASIPQEPSA
jgi:hypothetical protein